MHYKLEHPTERLVREFVDKYYVFEFLLLFLIVMLTSWIKSFPNLTGYCPRNLDNFTVINRFFNDEESSVTADSHYSLSTNNSEVDTRTNHLAAYSQPATGALEICPVYQTEIEPNPIPHTFAEETTRPRSCTYLCTRSGRKYARRQI
ncbi:uncharacterized protein LOC106666957 [Cimex lectularius]|uniref:Uncharacterized protein n=1 Tax=Cimex lectularius TaxID=79782 RepID=A0A8I6RQZ9_CIMLE|nr:uncharacterized protein LOC106666957 [Cimex lectularius]